MIGSGVSFKQCLNGISINGPVNGTKSGIFINADIGHVSNVSGDVNSTYGIY